MNTLHTLRIGEPKSRIYAVAVELESHEWQARIMMEPFHITDPHNSGQVLTEEQGRGFFPQLADRTYQGGLQPVASDRIMIAAHKAASERPDLQPQRILVVVTGASRNGDGMDGVVRSVWSSSRNESDVETIAHIHAVLDEADEDWFKAMVILAELEEAGSE
jgi:hypothetical protein